MIATRFACFNCGKFSYGDIVDHGFKLELHCFHCSVFIRHTTIDECDDFVIVSGKYKGHLVSELSETKQGKYYLENTLINKNSLKDWQRYVIDIHL